MRLAVISDIHGNLAALEAVLADIKARGVDRTVNLGDCVTSPLWPKETFEALQSLSLPTVRGNHDRWIEEFPDDKLSPAGLFARSALTAEQRRALHSLPSQIRLDDGILACHGTPDDDTTCLLEEALEDGRFVPARSRRADRAPFERANGACRAVWSQPPPGGCSGPGRPPGPQSRQRWLPGVRGHSFCRKPGHRSPHARYAILTKRTRGWQVELLALEYDWEAASAQALANGRPEWAEAMLSGHVK